MKHKENRVFIVFPGLGKTYLALHRRGVADCDYGYYRAGLRTETNDRQLLYFAQKVIHIYAKEGFLTLTNEPLLIPLLKQNGDKLAVVLPKEGIDMGQRIMERENEKPVNQAWAMEYQRNWKQWVNSWTVMARKYNIPIIYVEYLLQDYNVLLGKEC